MNKRRPLADRFWEKVDKSGDCWIWTGAKNKQGYGMFMVDRFQRNASAHRVSAELSGMDINGMLVLHTCDNPSCVNPEHLFVGTQKDNIDDCISKGRFRNRWGLVCPR